MKLCFFLTVLCVTCALSTHALNILAILPLSMKSHFAIGHSIVESLLSAGHNATVISMIMPPKPIDNYRTIHIPDTMNVSGWGDMNPLEWSDIPILLSVVMMPMMGADTVHEIMKSEELNAFLESDEEEFDLCIFEIFTSEALLGIAEKYNCVLIEYTTFDAFPWIDQMSGNESPPSYVPHPFLHFTDKMTFRERLWNGFFKIVDDLFYNLLHIPWQRHLYNKYFPNAKRSFDDMYRNASITFINNHVSNSFPRPHQPSQIEIGGIHVKPAKALPADLQEFLDSATEGAIFFSMGSYIDGTDWPLEKREAFVRVFRRLKQRVIWRYSNDTLPGNPGNIKIASWLPQRDILAHKNVKLFITHGGLLGTTEAIVEGVPVLGIPIFGDQLMNLAKACVRGYGLQLRLHEVNEENIHEKLTELLNNPKYKETAMRVSKRFNDRALSPQESVVYWTEYAVRHRGASHLQAEAVNMSFIEFHSLDVFLVLAVVCLTTTFVCLALLKKVLGKIRTGGKQKPKMQ